MEKGRGVSQLLVGVNMSHITGVGGVEGWGGRVDITYPEQATIHKPNCESVTSRTLLEN